MFALIQSEIQYWEETVKMRRGLWQAIALLSLTIVLVLSVPSKNVNAAGMTVTQAVIQGQNVVVTASGSSTSDDGILHLYAQQVYESGAQGIEVAQAPAGANPTFTFALGKGSANSNLYKKFTVVAVRGGVPTAVSNSRYITNPEAAATHTAGRKDGSKKGLLPGNSVLNPGTLKNMGVHQIIYNLPVGTLCTGGGVSYNYNGKTYNFNSSTVQQFDTLVSQMNNNGIQVTLILLNNLTGNAGLLHPLSRDNAGANYYAFNTMEQGGVEMLEAAASFLGQRYSNNGHGTVDNWVIGNEVNARAEWNYMNAACGLNTFAQEYAKAVRIFYNGIKSENANARVYISIDQEWSRGDSALHYGAKPFMDAMNSYLTAEGNIDWGVASHPYDVPLTDPVAWTKNSNYHPHSQSARYYTMENIDVLTDYLCQKALLSPTGQVRSVLCSEVGYSSTQGQDIQAASIVYAYLQAVSNQHIDGFILNREQDHATEIAQGLALGLLNPDGSKKLSWQYYVTAESAETQAAVSAIIGTPVTSLLTVR